MLRFTLGRYIALPSDSYVHSAISDRCGDATSIHTLNALMVCISIELIRRIRFFLFFLRFRHDGQMPTLRFPFCNTVFREGAYFASPCQVTCIHLQ